jgi:hypothetical protein
MKLNNLGKKLKSLFFLNAKIRKLQKYLHKDKYIKYEAG